MAKPAPGVPSTEPGRQPPSGPLRGMDNRAPSWHPRPVSGARDMTDITITPGPDTLRAYRDALACFGTGVTVVTTRTDHGPVAMTANSFASVSLEPPLVLWCPARASLRHDAFIATDRYAIHVMAEDQQETARHFARTGDDFAGIDWSADDSGLPLLSGCLARFECRRTAVHDGGDHSIVVGQVLKASFHGGKGLIFKHGEYGGFLRLD